MGTEKMNGTHQLADDGIIPRAVSYLFERLQAEETNQAIQSAASSIPSPSARKQSTASRLRPLSMLPHNTPVVADARNRKYTVKVSFIEIYNEELIDLLNDAPPEARPAITVREDMKGQLVWNGVTEATASNIDQVLRYVSLASRRLTTYTP